MRETALGLGFRPTFLAQRAGACAKGQTRRESIYNKLIADLDTNLARGAIAERVTPSVLRCGNGPSSSARR